MKKAKVVSSSDSPEMMRPAFTPEGRENQLVNLAVDLAEKQLREGTASSQVIVHYLKLGTSRANLEKEKLERENELLKAKTDSIQSAQRDEEFYDKVINALKKYGGNEEDEEDEYY